jgi:hypothetical protein
MRAIHGDDAGRKNSLFVRDSVHILAHIICPASARERTKDSKDSLGPPARTEKL